MSRRFVSVLLGQQLPDLLVTETCHPDRNGKSLSASSTSERDGKHAAFDLEFRRLADEGDAPRKIIHVAHSPSLNTSERFGTGQINLCLVKAKPLLNLAKRDPFLPNAPLARRTAVATNHPAGAA